MSNIALSALDQHYARAWEAMGDTTARAKRRRHGEANYRLVRYCTLCRRRHNRHKERNVMGHLAERDRPAIKARLRKAWAETDHARALPQLEVLAGELDRTHPGAAGSLREGMEETLTVIRLGIRGKLRRTLESTNACESMIEIIRRTQRNVKHCSSGEMGLRWTAAGMLEAEQQFRKVIGHTDLANLAVAIERDLDHTPQAVATTPTREAAIAVTV
jgi:hypothetical protein